MARNFFMDRSRSSVQAMSLLTSSRLHVLTVPRTTRGPQNRQPKETSIIKFVEWGAAQAGRTGLRSPRSENWRAIPGAPGDPPPG